VETYPIVNLIGATFADVMGQAPQPD